MVVMMAAVYSVQAQTWNWVFTKSDGTVEKIPLSQIQKIAFVVEGEDGSSYTLKLKDAENSVEVTLAENPVITVEDGEVKVTSNNGSTITFDPQSITESEVIDNSATGVRNLIKDDTEIAFGRVAVNSLTTSQKVFVTTIDGKTIKEVAAGTDGRVEIDLNSLPQGVYVVRTPNNSFKITR